jgi:hypothetical protein
VVIPNPRLGFAPPRLCPAQKELTDVFCTDPQPAEAPRSCQICGLDLSTLQASPVV